MDTVTIDQATQLAATDFSLWALFIRADIVVKLVMIGLIVASVMSWSIIIEKIMTYRRVRQQAEEFEALFWSGETLQNIYRQLASGEASPSVRVFNAAMREWVRHDGNRRKTEAGAIIPSIERALTNAVAREMEALESRLLFLATVGAVAPFVGLFGTVWGIMNSFQAIAMSRDTNLAVVAPGIAEALFATGLGLLAAIPAVVAYNACAASVQRFASRLDHFADDFINLMARQNTRKVKAKRFGFFLTPAKRARRRRHYQPMAEINVTPMVDVMLVLLIVFMVAAPLLTVGVPVNLPKTGAQALRGDDEPLAISINAQGQIFLQDTQIQKTMLVPRLKAIAGEGYEQRIYVRGDKTVNYGLVANVVSEISAAGFARVALVTEKAGQEK